MALPIFRYPLDLTGINLNNLVVDELHVLNNLAKRAIIPKYSPYFGNSLVVKDNANLAVLQKGVHYECIQLTEEAVIKTGLEIYEVILITDPGVSSEVLVTYQVLGGLYQRTSDAILDLYNTLINDNRPISWPNVLNKPLNYPPSLHNHLFRDIIGYEPLIAELERLRNAIMLSNTPALQATIDYIDSLEQELRDYIDSKATNEVIMIKPDLLGFSRGSTQNIELEAVNIVTPYQYYWSIEHLTTTSDEFTVDSGVVSLRTGFNNFSIGVVRPMVNMAETTFKINIRKDSLVGPIIFRSGVLTLARYTVTTIADIMLNKSCIYSPDVVIDPLSLFIKKRCSC